ncbi:MAG: hypothetical protein EOO06_10725 [Chitinophagaceae bacterium]|nr:MAG: hypothetical protein EOO06_10725 [Chitinophagaceae bacterium]
MTYTDKYASTAKQFPYRLSKNDPTLCEWIINNDQPFHEPFFDETISRLRYLDVNQRKFKMVAHIDLLRNLCTGEERPPTAIIFHVSRCGSTLFSQVLNLRPEHLVLAEVPFFDQLLRLHYKGLAYAPSSCSNLFNAALQLYIQNNATKANEVFIKADSWHLHFYPEIRRLFPETPFILLYRHPTEVLRSQQKRRGIQSVPGLLEPGIFGFDENEMDNCDLDKYMTSVLDTYFRKMIEIAATDSNIVLINYAEGIMTGMQKIAAITNLPFEEGYQRLAMERAGFHAKYPEQRFAENAEEISMPPNLPAVIELYKQLDNMNVIKATGS